MAQTQITSKAISPIEFESALKKFDSKGNGFVSVEDIDEILSELQLREKFSDDRTVELKHHYKEKILQLGGGEGDRISVETLKQVLVPRENILLQIPLDSKLTSIDFMRIWNHYDTDKDGYLDFKQLHGFVHDIMAKKNVDVSTEQVEKATQSFIDVFDRNQDSLIELSELAKILPVEQNFLQYFQTRKNISRKSFDKIWEHYDQDNSGTISGDELDAFIRDFYTKTDKENPSRLVSPPDLQTIKKQKEMLMMLVDQNSDNQLAKEELQLFFSVQS